MLLSHAKGLNTKLITLKPRGARGEGRITAPTQIWTHNHLIPSPVPKILTHPLPERMQSTVLYGVVLKGLLTFLGSLYKEGMKTTSRTLVYRFERQATRKNISCFQKHWVLDLACRSLSQEPSDSCFYILTSYVMENKMKKISINSWWRMNVVIVETVEALETWYSIFLSGSSVIFKNQDHFVLVISHDTIGKQ